MPKSLKQMAGELKGQRTLRHRAYAAFTALAIMVSMTTMYSLVQPASTMAAECTCGMEEHVHDESCYTMELVCEKEESVLAPIEEEGEAHVHDESCYEQRETLSCGETESAGHTHTDACRSLTCTQSESAGHSHGGSCYEVSSSLTCTESESAGHSHGSGCYDEEGNLTCGETESSGHTHGSGCHTEEKTLVCTEAQSAGHTHGSSCYSLTCGSSESTGHTHTDACKTVESVLVCTQGTDGSSESTGHTHTDACYQKVLICGKTEHTHTESCYTKPEQPVTPVQPDKPATPAGELICEALEHTHGEGCYDEQGNLICETSEHTHDEDCYAEPAGPITPTGELICEVPEHTHGEGCYDEQGNLICETSEHTHDEGCYAEPALLPQGVPEGYTDARAFENTQEGFVVTVYAPEGVIPEDVSLVAELLPEDSDGYATAAENLKASEEVADYDGFVALDIRLEDADGEAYEPSTEVYVDIQATCLLPTDVSPETVAVQHHVETEADKLLGFIPNPKAETGVTIEVVADSGKSTGDVTVTHDEDDAAGLVSVFAVESFSTFTITWSSGQNSIKIDIICYDAATNTQLPAGTVPAGISLTSGTTVNLNAQNTSLAISGYALERATRFNGSNETAVTWIKATRGGSRWSYAYDNQSGTSSKPTIRLYYREAVLTVTDTIPQNGSLKATLSNSQTAPAYEWYRASSINTNSGYELVPGETGSTLSVVADGARRYYYAKAVLAGGKTLQSQPFQVPYYDSLKNGGFETPKYADVSSVYQKSFASSKFMQIPHDTEGLIWQTTGYGTMWVGDSYGYYIEIADGATASGAFGTTRPGQFAELNCQVYGALYQDILTEPGSTLYWGLEHSGRGRETMQVFIVDPANFSTPSSGQIWPQGTPGLQATITDGRDDWNFYTQDSGAGPYLVPAGQYITRFYFLSCNGGSADGNLLDNITFSKEQPQAPEGYGTLTIEKTVSGIPASSVLPASFTFTVTGLNEETNQQETLYTVHLPTADGSWTRNLVLHPGDYTVTETANAVQGASHLGTTVAVGSGSAASNVTASVTLEQDETTRVSYINSYEANDNGAAVEKRFVDAQGNAVTPPANLHHIDLTFKQYYLNSAGNKVYLNAGAALAATLEKTAGGDFVGNIATAAPYVHLELVSEALKDEDGNTLINTADWQGVSMVWDYSAATVNSTTGTTAEGQTGFTLAATGFLLLPSDGGYTLYMPSAPAGDEARAAVIAALKTKLSLSDSTAVAFGTAPGTTVNDDRSALLSFPDLEEATSYTLGFFALSGGDVSEIIVTNEVVAGTLSLTKTVSRTDAVEPDLTAPYTFHIKFPTGLSLEQSYAVTYSTGLTEGSTHTNGTLPVQTDTGASYLALELYHGETAVIAGLPAGVSAALQIEELGADGYTVSWTGSLAGAPSATGSTVTTAGFTGSVVEITCINTTGARLPNTGGIGTKPFMLLGTLMTLGAGLPLLGGLWRRKKEGVV